ncbi:hypothetical protein B0H17DRAFT_1125624 [Mycena rosella]|uniref:Uncharacterized protein n=1 Tax=Mycena rosella TaxID=1033263 RepID=A0AAD7GWT7_MYCRO|nr:hypothetical protein B0H17DRAFT_1125624 [Mycena rosella]
MFWLWLGLKAAALARPGVALAQKNSRLGQTIWLWLGPAWLWPGPRLTSEFSNHPKQIQKVFKKSNIKGTSEAAAFWLGFGLGNHEAGPKANPGQNFGLALALFQG